MSDGKLLDSIAESLRLVNLRVDELTTQITEERACRIEISKLVNQLSLGFIQQPLAGSLALSEAINVQHPVVYSKAVDVGTSSSDVSSETDAEQETPKRLTYWRYVPNDGKDIIARNVADINGEKVGKRIPTGTVLQVTQEVLGPDGVLYLQLAEGGWLFDRKPGVGTLCVRHEEENETEQINFYDTHKLSCLFMWLKSAMSEQADRTKALAQRCETLFAAQALTQQAVQGVREQCQQDVSNISGVMSSIGHELSELSKAVKIIGDGSIQNAHEGSDCLQVKNQPEIMASEFKNRLEGLELDIASQNRVMSKVKATYEMEAERLNKHDQQLLMHSKMIQVHGERIGAQSVSLGLLSDHVFPKDGLDSSSRSTSSPETPSSVFDSASSFGSLRLDASPGKITSAALLDCSHGLRTARSPSAGLSDGPTTVHTEDADQYH